MKTGTVAFNKAKTKFEAFFVAKQMFTITNLLWQLMVNETWAGRTFCFYPVEASKKTSQFQVCLVEKDKDGYTPMRTLFNKEMTFTEASKVCIDMNKELLGLCAKDIDEIVSSSMPKAEI